MSGLRAHRTRLLAAVLLAGLVLLGVELSAGGLGYGGSTRATSCGATAPSYPGDGIDAAVQRVVLDGLEEAACTLGTTREELVLSFGDSPAGEPVRWSPETIEQAVRGGLEGAIDRAVERGDLPGLVAVPLRAIARNAPVAWLVGRGEDVGGLFDALGDLIG
jgi:hypothetical protein